MGITSMHLGEVGEQRECVGVPKRNVEDAVVSECGHGSNGSGLLASSQAGCRDEYTRVLPRKRPLHP